MRKEEMSTYKSKLTIGLISLIIFLAVSFCTIQRVGGGGEAVVPKPFNMGDSVITTDELNVRDAPGTGSNIIKTMHKGTAGTILDGPQSKDGYAWWKIRYDDGVVGWSSDHRLEKYNRPPPKFSVGDPVEATANLHVHEKPGTDYNIIKTMPAGSKGTIQNFSDPKPRVVDGYCWWYIKWSDGTTGWSVDAYLKKTTVDNPPNVEAFDVQPREGHSFTISYTVSDDKGLARVELWRADDSGGNPVNWQKIKEVSISGTRYSGSFTDAPTVEGYYWYGIHVFDTKGQWVTEPSPIRVKVPPPSITNPTIYKTFSVMVRQGQSVEDTIIIYNPNNVKITVKSFTITDYRGFKGTVTCLTSLPFDIPAKSNGEIRVRITAASDCPAGTYTIYYRIRGDPNNWYRDGD